MIKGPDDFLNDLYLTFEYFGAGPGCGGIAALWTKRSADGLLLIMNGDVSEDESYNTVTMCLSSDAGWREACVALIKNHAFAFYTDGDTSGEYAWPFKIDSKGQNSLGKLMITWTWAGPPLSSIVESLSLIDDTKIEVLLEAFGELNTAQKMESLIHKFNLLAEHKISTADIIEEIGDATISMMSMRKAFLGVARRKKAISVRNALERSQALAPFRVEIEQIMARWHERLQGSGWAFAMGRGIRAAAIKSYMEDFVLNNGVMPQGLHSIQKVSYSINFDHYTDE